MRVALRLPLSSIAVTAAVASLIALAGLPSATAHAFCRLTTEMPIPGATCAADGKGLSWQRQCISFSMIDRGQPEPPFESIRNVADTSFRTWTAVDCADGKVALDVRQTSDLALCEDPEYSTRGPNANTIIFVTNWSGRDLPTDAFGLTLVWHNPDTGEIYDADMQINEKLGTPAICKDGCPSGGVDLQNVITHEAGHFFGLGHSDVFEATMSPRATMGETSKRDLADDDIEGLCSIYGNRAPISCEPSDFLPNHGFTTMCSEPTSASSSPASCTVTAPGSHGGAQAGAFLVALVWIPLLRRCWSRTRRAIG